MDVTFRGKRFNLNEPTQDYVTQKLQRLSRYLPMASQATIDVKGEGKGEERFVVQVTVNANGTFLRAEERASQLAVAIDAAVAALARQAQRFKGRLYRSERRSRDTIRGVPLRRQPVPEDLDDTELVLGRLVKVKRFPLKPMTEEEAIEQMELLGHDFFLFQDVSRGGYALLYRRRDGDYGLIVPEPA